MPLRSPVSKAPAIWWLRISQMDAMDIHQKQAFIQIFYEKVLFSPSGIAYCMQKIDGDEIRPLEERDFEGFEVNCDEILCGGERLAVRTVVPHRPADDAALLVSLTTMDARDFLTEAYNSVPVRWFARRGHTVAAFDAPYHGARAGGHENGLAAIRDALLEGDAFFERFCKEASAVLDLALAKGHGAAGRVCLCGTSRFGYMVARAFAADRRSAALAMFCPVTDFGALAEFAECRGEPAIARQSLKNFAGALAGRFRYRWGTATIGWTP